jgi:hypothetical protein
MISIGSTGILLKNSSKHSYIMLSDLNTYSLILVEEGDKFIFNIQYFIFRKVFGNGDSRICTLRGILGFICCSKEVFSNLKE